MISHETSDNKDVTRRRSEQHQLNFQDIVTFSLTDDDEKLTKRQEVDRLNDDCRASWLLFVDASSSFLIVSWRWNETIRRGWWSDYWLSFTVLLGKDSKSWKMQSKTSPSSGFFLSPETTPVTQVKETTWSDIMKTKVFSDEMLPDHKTCHASDEGWHRTRHLREDAFNRTSLSQLLSSRQSLEWELSCNRIRFLHLLPRKRHLHEMIKISSDAQLTPVSRNNININTPVTDLWWLPWWLQTLFKCFVTRMNVWHIDEPHGYKIQVHLRHFILWSLQLENHNFFLWFQ